MKGPKARKTLAKARLATRPSAKTGCPQGPSAALGQPSTMFPSPVWGDRIFDAKTQKGEGVQPRMKTDGHGLSSPQKNPGNSSGAEPRRECQSLSGNSLLGRTGHWPVPPGDSPGVMGSVPRGNEDGSFAKSRRALPVGGSPTGTGGSPVLPIFRTRFNR